MALFVLSENPAISAQLGGGVSQKRPRLQQHLAYMH